MGLSFHYRGVIKNKTDLPALIEEVETLAKTHDWEYFIFETSFPQKEYMNNTEEDISGICFTPPKSETIDICFDANGRMSSLLHQQMWKNSDHPKAKNYMYLLSVKTQSAGMHVHSIIIDFFRYISKKYLKDFELTDEGKYWETQDLQVLKKQFDKYNNIMDSFQLGLESTPPESKENLIAYLERIAGKTHKYLRGKRE